MADRIHWRCFHCGETFTRAQERWAREHFGRDEGATPVCLIRSAGEAALLSALRRAEYELASYRLEDTALLRAMWAMQSDHQQALIRAEEDGYNKGVREVGRLRELLHQQLDRQYNPFEPDNQSENYKRLKSALEA